MIQAFNADWLNDAAELAERVTGLPAVATLDWCDRAAECLLRIPGASVVGVVLATVSGSGRVMDLEAAGFAAPGSDPATRERMLWFRSRAETMRTVGWTPNIGETFRAPVAGVMSEMPGGALWRSGPVGHLATDIAGAELAIGHLALGDMVVGRSITIMCVTDQASAASAAALIRAVLPVLCRRALCAIGPARATRNHWLSPREQKVLELLTLGRSVREIADELGRSPHTVHDHVKALHRKLGANSRGELVARALGHNMPLRPAPGVAVEAITGSQLLAEPKPQQPKRVEDTSGESYHAGR